MRTLAIALVVFAASLTLDAASNHALTNEQIITLTQKGMPDNIIVQAIQRTQCSFNTTADALIALKQAKVSDAVIGAMLSRNSTEMSNGDTASTNPLVMAAANQRNITGVVKDSTGKSVQLTRERQQYDSDATNAKHTIVRGLGGAVSFMGTKNTTRIQLPGDSSKTRVPDGKISLLIQSDPTSRVTLVSLTPYKTNRVLSSGKSMMGQNMNDMRLTEIETSTVNNEGEVILTPSQNLTPGNYAVVVGGESSILAIRAILTFDVVEPSVAVSHQ